jgi:hypothetical protein
MRKKSAPTQQNEGGETSRVESGKLNNDVAEGEGRKIM